MKFNIEVKVILKKGMLNPEAATIERALALLDYKVSNTETIDVIKFSMYGEDEESIQNEVDDMCQKLLCNPVIHDYEIKISAEE